MQKVANGRALNGEIVQKESSRRDAKNKGGLKSSPFFVYLKVNELF